MSHVPLEELAAFVDGRLEGDAVSRVEQELDRCAECRAIVGQLARDVEHAGTAAAARAKEDATLRALGETVHDPLLGALIGGRYRVRSRLGAGAMGVVYAAEHVLLGREVALKVLHPELARSAEIARRFRNEARAAAAVGHPGIALVIDLGRTEGGAPFLVMEKLEGQGLDALLQDARILAPPRAARIARDIALAVHAAHERGIVHRDLKPANVFLAGSRERVKVLDFGISKIAELASLEATRTGAVMGTPQYMAPEQFVDASRVGPAADVYALGAILYRMLAGRPPHDASTLPALARAATSEAPPALRDVASQIPAGLAAIVHRALSREPTDRHASMAQLAEGLAPWAETTSIERAPATLPPPSDTRRAVVAVRVIGVRDASALRASMARHGGRLVDDALVVFGHETWTGDELAHAIAAALDGASYATSLLVAPARLTRGGEISIATVDLASPARGGVLVSAAFAPLLGTRYQLDDAGDGFVRIAGARASRDAAPLVGRDVERAQLGAWLDTVLDEARPEVFVLRGAPGIGKTRLTQELAARLAPERGFVVLSSRCDPRGARRPFAAMGGLVAGLDPVLAAWREGDARTPAELADAARRVASLAPDASASGIGELLDVTLDAQAGQGGGARATRDRARVAALDVLGARAHASPLAIVLEDVQWADVASLDLLAELSVRAASAPLAVFLSARDDAPPLDEAVARGLPITELRVRGLRRRDVAQLARAELGDVVPDALIHALHERSGGNPFFVQQLCAALGRAPSASALPPSVEGAVQAQLDALGEIEREICRRASIVEGAFGAPELAALGVPDAAPFLDELARRELLRRLPGEATRYAFRTPLLAEVIAGLLGDTTRRESHARFAAWLEASGETTSERVARHWEGAGEPARASRAYVDAAIAALRRGDVEATERCASRAVALGVAEDARHALHLARAEALEVLGRQSAQAEALEAALGAARTAGERAAARTLLAVVRQRLGRSEDALALLETAVVEAEESGDPEALARALGKRSAVLVYASRLDEAAASLVRAERLVTLRVPQLRAEAAVWRAQLAAARGDLGDRHHAYWAAVELYREMGDLRLAAGAGVNLADVLNRVRAFDDAERALLEALERCRRLSMHLMEGYALANLAYARLQLGRADEALATLDDAERIAKSAGEERLARYARLYRVLATARAARHHDAIALATALIDDAHVVAERPVEALALGARARSHLACDRREAALDDARRAITIRDAIGSLEEDDVELFVTLAAALAACGHDDDAMRARARADAERASVAARISDAEWRARYLEGTLTAAAR
ncbi:Adenylate cyclase [Sandaracinus amylolyticus]|uniref:Adenylate cyclase n=1 Tax=Sandaracinus amylolyticus TaxID=927083 RepID=A0A0F6W8C1_9BACT|nr:Adenylate cyclase [Sandaracinus amylolyticus]